MKAAWIVLCTLLVVSAAGFAEAPGKAPLTSEALTAILGPGEAPGSCAPGEGGVVFAAKRPRAVEKALCTATVTCESGTISCQGNNSSTSCSATDRNCEFGIRGRVTCDGVTTECPTGCPCGTPDCCFCAATGDCFSCCRCNGGSSALCNKACFGPPLIP